MIRPYMEILRTPIEDMMLEQMKHQDDYMLFAEDCCMDEITPDNVLGDASLFGDSSSSQDLLNSDEEESDLFSLEED